MSGLLLTGYSSVQYMLPKNISYVTSKMIVFPGRDTPEEMRIGLSNPPGVRK